MNEWTDLVGQGVSHLRGGRHLEAAIVAEQAIHCAPRDPVASLVLGISLGRLGRLSDAIQWLQFAAGLAPQDAQIRFNLAVCLAEAGQTELAMVEYARCLQIAPDYADALWNYGEMLRLREHFRKALECFDRLERIEGKRRAKMAHRMAVCCAYLGLHERADTLFSQQLAEDEDPVTHWEYSLYLLGCGRFDAAWPHYGKRFEAGARISLQRAEYPFALWGGEFERDAVLLVDGEQGAGDEILFSCFFAGLIQRAAGAGMRVVIACHPGLVRLMQASFPGAHLLAHNVARPADVQAAVAGARKVWRASMGDLPCWLPKPETAAYLVPDQDDVALMKSLLGSSGHVRVGLVWSANPHSQQTNRRQRNVDPVLLNAVLDDFQRTRPDVAFYSLQSAEHCASLSHLADLPVRDMSGVLTDFSRTAALMKEMDVVVSVCTSTANLAGALGCDTRVLLKTHADWRWLSDTAWYPHVRTYRQQVYSDWSAPLAGLFREIGDSNKSRNKIEVGVAP
ncbi:MULTISPECIES: tetratricopeptide repeat-containing glycosyltransferase family protein [Paraburkholderia]|uniref:tetratricopeptide repeat-containing glycosyltransferase family protein n=1 Tax=Paraburkholderia TaxID=1822464 RepID=UPI002252A316|nr:MULTISPECIES: tetratricopeptide repeat-containing glycosyltransferase family protein [Paraburkholderia]MCX4159644.1 tetratricopeptide repeat-containing glycosyltransferase family protein [Paraburkholderia aspalathi]MDN7169042.1 tetratricopeptide repeat-containing glycosyltransferase family protein [Paraburkholderia sp. SECH2]MDQ6397529.1 tetratricopeptide repeat-containing glycosyltransferase family protein [Paraburkholderia aspalathi]